MKILSIFILTICCNLLFGQLYNGVPFITNYTSLDYEKINQTQSITQDDRGFMYFASINNILEYDGHFWNHYQLNNKSKIRTLAKAKNGKIYVGAFNELGYLYSDISGKTKYKSLVNSIPKKQQDFGDIWRIGFLNDTVVFQSHHKIFIWAKNKMQVIEMGKYFHSAFVVNNKIWINSKEDGLYVCNNRKVTKILQGELPLGSWVNAIIPYNEKSILITTYFDGIFIYDGKKIVRWKTSIDDNFFKNQIYSALKLDDNHFAIGTIQKGVVILNNHGGLESFINQTNGLQNNTAINLFLDKNKNLWCGNNFGVDFIELNSPFLLNNVQGGAGLINSIQFYKKKMYIGTNQGLYYQELNPNEFYLKSPIENKFIKGTEASILSLDTIGNELIGGHNFGTLAIENDKASFFSRNEGGWCFKHLLLTPGYVIEGTYTGLIIYKLDKNGNLLKNTLKLVKGFHESCRYIEQDNLGYIWISHTSKGIYRLRLTPKLDSVIDVNFFNSTNGLPSNYENNVFSIDGKMAFTTEKGIYEFNYNTQMFEPNKKINNDLNNINSVDYLFQDKEKDIWFTSNGKIGLLKHISKLENQLITAPFKCVQGLFGTGFSVLKVVDEQNVYVFTKKGIVHFNPTKINITYLPSSTYIRKVKISKNEDSTLFDGNFSNSKGEIIQKQYYIPEIKYKYNSIEFSFSSPSYSCANESKFQYYLEGNEEKWSNWKQTNKKEYTNLHEGHYVFHVRSMNYYGKVDKEGTYEFSILPPFYRTWYAYLIYLLISFILVNFAFKLISIKIKKVKERVENEKRIELQLKEEERQNEALIAKNKIIILETEKLENELHYNKNQLTNIVMNNSRKNELLISLKSKIEALSVTGSNRHQKKIRDIVKMLESNLTISDNWAHFEILFNSVHQDFLKKLKDNYPDLSDRSRMLCAYLRMKLSTKEIADLMNISTSAIEKQRYRLRKSLGLETKDSLSHFLENL